MSFFHQIEGKTFFFDSFSSQQVIYFITEYLVTIKKQFGTVCLNNNYASVSILGHQSVTRPKIWPF